MAQQLLIDVFPIFEEFVGEGWTINEDYTNEATRPVTPARHYEVLSQLFS